MFWSFLTNSDHFRLKELYDHIPHTKRAKIGVPPLALLPKMLLIVGQWLIKWSTVDQVTRGSKSTFETSNAFISIAQIQPQFLWIKILLWAKSRFLRWVIWSKLLFSPWSSKLPRNCQRHRFDTRNPKRALFRQKVSCSFWHVYRGIEWLDCFDIFCVFYLQLKD